MPGNVADMTLRRLHQLVSETEMKVAEERIAAAQNVRNQFFPLALAGGADPTDLMRIWRPGYGL